MSSEGRNTPLRRVRPLRRDPKILPQDTSVFQVRERSTNPNVLVRISSGGEGGLPLEGVWAKKFGMSFETLGKQTSWRDRPGL